MPFPSSMYLFGKSVIITGASDGIGKALSRAFAKRGALLVLFARSEAPLRKLAEEIGIDRAVPVPGDVRKVEDIKKAIASAVANFGRLDVLVNNAGVGLVSEISEIRTDDFRDVWATNIEGPLCAMREAASIMRQRRGGIIVNVSSMVTRFSSAGGGGYRATKMALEALSEAARLELANDNIRILIARPGLTSTNFSSHCLGTRKVSGTIIFGYRPGRSAEYVAERIVEGVRRETPEIHMSFFSALSGRAALLFPGIAREIARFKRKRSVIRKKER
ncbi:MAG TPA: SDR family NAD(P)-dependent oxidoreductase [Chitinispirillaceae bacterium]|nr:SDR family NAD(P)-dependent oxidoreductase [Chitinispirillaceae bacterium]